MPAARPVRPLAFALAWGVAAALGLAGAPHTAHADCQPDPAANGDTVTCSADDTDGFAAPTMPAPVQNLTVVVQSGATVDDGAADANAITLNDENAVTVEAGAAITADGDGSHGISIGNDNNNDDMDGDGVDNAGSITVTGNNAGGISGGNANDVTNSGSIDAGQPGGMTTGAFGIRLGDGTPGDDVDAVVTNEATGTIEVLGDDVVGVQATGDRATVDNEGSITVGLPGDTMSSSMGMPGSIGVDVGDDALVTNAAGASISASGDGAIGVRMGSDTTLPDPMGMEDDLVNEGMIDANGGLGSATGAVVGDDIVVHNAEFGRIEASGNGPDPMNMDMPAGVPVIGLQLGADTTLDNEGTVNAVGADGTGVLATGGAGSTTTINNMPTGIISASGDGGVAIQGGDGIEKVTNEGVIIGTVDLGGGDDELTLVPGAGVDELFGGSETTADALHLVGDRTSTVLDLDLATVHEFESIDIDAMVTDMDTMVTTFGTWEIGGTLGGGMLPESLPGGLHLVNGTLRMRDAATIMSAAGFTMDDGTTLQILLDPNAMTNGDLVLSGGGDINLNGDNTLVVTQLAPIPMSTSYMILETDGTRNGVFENTPADTPLLQYQVNYLPSSVTLDITRLSYGVVAETPNQSAMGEYLDRILATGGNGPGVDALLVLLDTLGPERLRSVYDGLQPEAYDAHTGQVAALGRAFAEAAIEPRLLCKPAFFGLDPGPMHDIPCGRTGFTAWMKLLFSESDRDAGSDFLRSSASRQALAGGFDWRPYRYLTVTGYMGIGRINLDVPGVGSGDVQSYEFGAAVTARLGGAHASATLGYGRGDHEQNRTIDFGVSSISTNGKFNSNRIQSLVELGWLFEKGNFQLEPLARMGVTWVEEDAFTESDVSGINVSGFELDVDQRNNVLVGTQFGGRLRYRHYQSAYSDDVIPYTQGTWTPEISASWRSVWTGANREITARLSGAGDAGDVTVEAEDSQQGLDVGAKLTFQPHGSGGSFSIGYDGFIGDKSTDHRFGAALEIYF